ncbi:MAG: alpha/beta fold hydrolase, partial [Myxococcaceae bacterium]
MTVLWGVVHRRTGAPRATGDNQVERRRSRESARAAERLHPLHRMKHLGTTQPYRGPDGSILAGSITEVRYLRLGGVDQWVMLRGESISNPPLILLHGGPGMPESGMFRHFNGPLEKHFTLVYWDQRGAGKSFSRTIPRASMTVEQFIADLDELVEYVRRRLSKDKVVIYGHSWGSALGVLYAARFPSKVAVYAGSGQIGDSTAAESASYAFALAEAERRHDRKALRKLRAIGPPPYGPGKLFTERMQLARLDRDEAATSAWTMWRAVLGRPESSILDLPNIVRGFRFSLQTMWAETSCLNLPKLAPNLQMPVFFLLGRKDHWVPP